jgi:hypothetical protein
MAESGCLDAAAALLLLVAGAVAGWALSAIFPRP